jgi:hypothetical protein
MKHALQVITTVQEGRDTISLLKRQIDAIAIMMKNSQKKIPLIWKNGR